MEWVETTGPTVEDAKDAALDQLGVDEQEAEFEVLEEPRTGLFGRLRGEARVRARVTPRQPRAKAERGARRRRSGAEPKRARGGGSRNRGSKGDSAGDRSTGGGDGAEGGGAQDRGSQDRGAKVDAGGAGDTPPRGGRNSARGGRNRPAPSAPSDAAPAAPTAAPNAMTTTKEQEQAMSEDVTVEEQAEIVEGFLEGLVEAFGVDAEIHHDRVDDDTIELDLVGADLGLLIGPKGRTLWAIQELSRTVVQRQATGTHHGRVRIDVGGYRQRRKEALERFTRQLAAEVQESGVARSLEPMAAADRKIVHDTVNDMDGISTTSEGEEPRRRVVIVPGD